MTVTDVTYRSSASYEYAPASSGIHSTTIVSMRRVGTANIQFSCFIDYSIQLRLQKLVANASVDVQLLCSEYSSTLLALQDPAQ